MLSPQLFLQGLFESQHQFFGLDLLICPHALEVFCLSLVDFPFRSIWSRAYPKSVVSDSIGFCFRSQAY